MSNYIPDCDIVTNFSSSLQVVPTARLAGCSTLFIPDFVIRFVVISVVIVMNLSVVLDCEEIRKEK